MKKVTESVSLLGKMLGLFLLVVGATAVQAEGKLKTQFKDINEANPNKSVKQLYLGFFGSQKSGWPVDETGQFANWYDATDAVHIGVLDGYYGGNGVSDTISVLLQTGKELDTAYGGSGYTATTPVPSANTLTTGKIAIVETFSSAQNLHWTWTVTGVEESQLAFTLEGRTDPGQADADDGLAFQATIAADSFYYTPDNGMFTLKVDRGVVGSDFEVNDSFTFETIEGTHLGKKITLTENMDTGYFYGDATGTVIGAALSVDKYDTITMHYQRDDDGVSKIYTVKVPYAEKVLSGPVGETLAANTKVLALAANTKVLAMGDIVVADGETLTVNKGVEIRFNANVEENVSFNDPVLGDPSRVEMFVHGTLKVTGDATDSVLFTSGNVSAPQSDDWGGIFLDGSNATATLDMAHATVEYAKGYGIKLKAGDADTVKLTNVTIQENAGHGILSVGDYEDASGTILLDGVQILNNRVFGQPKAAYAIYQTEHGWDDWKIVNSTISNRDMLWDGDTAMDGAGILLHNTKNIYIGDSTDTSSGYTNTISGNSSGIELRPYYAQHVEVLGVKLENNESGLYIDLGINALMGTQSEGLRVEGNKIDGNTGDGLHLLYERLADATDDLRIVGNSVLNQSGYGIYAYTSTRDSSSRLLIEDNTLTDNKLGGLYLGGESDLKSDTLTGNDFQATINPLNAPIDPLNAQGDISQRWAVVNATIESITVAAATWGDTVQGQLDVAKANDAAAGTVTAAQDAVAESVIYWAPMGGGVAYGGSVAAPSGGSIQGTTVAFVDGTDTNLVYESKESSLPVKITTDEQLTSFRLVFQYDQGVVSVGDIDISALPTGWKLETDLIGKQVGNDSMVYMVATAFAGAASAPLDESTELRLPVQILPDASVELDATGTWLTLDASESIVRDADGEISGATFTSKYLKLVKAVEMAYSEWGLGQGWNLVGFPMQLDDATDNLRRFINGVVDASDSTVVESIWAEDLVNGGWVSYHSSLPIFLNSLQKLKPDVGYWVNLRAAPEVPTDWSDKAKGWRGDEIATRSDLVEGFNLVVALESYDKTTIKSYLESLGVSVAWGWKNGGGNGSWKSYNVAVPSFLNSLTELKQGQAYYFNKPTIQQGQ